VAESEGEDGYQAKNSCIRKLHPNLAISSGKYKSIDTIAKLNDIQMMHALWLAVHTVQQHQNHLSHKDVIPMFPCAPDNIYHGEPKQNSKGKLPWKACVSTEYKSAHLKLDFPDDEGRFNILTKCLPDSVFTSKEDRAMVLLDENDV
jgi:hypothetical protein